MNNEYTFQKLLDIMETLRGENGCPWDREQTHDTLKKYILEESYEVIDAIEEGSREKQCDELGDVLLQIVFQSQIASEEKSFTIDDVINSICKKLIRRHPHIFGETTLSKASEVEQKWQEIKKEEKKQSTYTEALKDLPKGMSSLMKSYKIQKKAAEVGFDWDNVEDAIKKVYEELDEVEEARTLDDPQKIDEEIGDLLFAVVNVARKLKVEPETSLNSTIKKFITRFSYIEQKAVEKNIKLDDMNLEEMDKLWNEAKVMLK